MYNEIIFGLIQALVYERQNNNPNEDINKICNDIQLEFSTINNINWDLIKEDYNANTN